MNSTPADGRSTNVSSVGTPLASGVSANGQKLKLTFNGNREGFTNGDDGDSRLQSDDD